MVLARLGIGMDQRDDWHLTEEIRHQLGRGDPFAAAVRATRMPMVITDPQRHDNPIVYVNEAFQRLTGYERDEIVGRNCRFLQGPDTDPGTVAKIRDAIEAGTDVDVDLMNYRKDGTTFWNALYMSPVRDDDGSIRFFFASQLDVTERVELQARLAERRDEVEREVERRTADLKAALEAKTLLLHEVDHRVKNNLAMVGSLIRMQTRTIDDPAIAEKLSAMLERIDALGAVHRRLYQSDDVARFDVGAFAASLAADVLAASGRDDIVLRTDVAPLVVPADMASPLGLVVNEVLTNAVKHAYKDGRPGVVTVAVRRDGSTGRIEIADDGPGIGRSTGRTGLGQTLVARLSRQLRARAVWSDAAPGTRVTLAFPVPE